MLPGRAASGPLDQLGQQGEDRRRIAPRGRRFARRQADLALGHGIAGDGVHQQQDVLALIAKVFGDRRGGSRRLHADQGRLVAGGHDDDALGQALRTEVALDELVHLAAALADQGDDVHVGRRIAGHHAQQHALAHARSGEDPHPLPLAAGQQAVDGADAGGQRLVDPRPRAGVRRLAVQGSPLGQRRLRLAVHGPAGGADHAPQQPCADPQPADGLPQSHAVAVANARQVAQGVQQSHCVPVPGSRKPMTSASSGGVPGGIPGTLGRGRGRLGRAGFPRSPPTGPESRPPRLSCRPSAPRCP